MNYKVDSNTGRLKKLNLYLQVTLYAGAGINHFIHPDFYLRIIPPYLPFHSAINVVSGITEIVLALLLVFHRTRRLAAYMLITLLILFIPAHIYMIQISNCSAGKFCFPLLIAWLRLIPGQPLLIWWAWIVMSYER